MLWVLRDTDVKYSICYGRIYLRTYRAMVRITGANIDAINAGMTDRVYLTKKGWVSDRLRLDFILDNGDLSMVGRGPGIVDTKVTKEDTQSYILSKLKDKWWRMTSGEIYRIKDKDGNNVKFIPNEFQLYYLLHKHNRNIILKARQMGFSTIVQLDFLDDALFTKNLNVGIIAQDMPTAQLIRKDKIEFALDNLPIDIKGFRQYDKSNSKEIILDNGSSIYISNSFRGGTLQRLHVSEYAKICAKRPEKAKEIKTGALESVAMNQQIVIESTAEGNEGDFYDKCETYNVMVGKPLTPLDFKFFFFPWWLDTLYAYESDAIEINGDNFKYFKKLEKEYGILLSDGQKNRYQLKKKEKGDDMFKEYPSLYKEAFLLATEGSYYEAEINIAYQQGRISSIAYDPNLMVYTCRDIGGAGGGDDTSIRFFQIFGREIRFIDYREGSGYSMVYCLEHVIKEKPYLYAKHIGPHDMNIHERTSGTTRLQTARQMGFDFDLVQSPAGAISARHEIVRNLFPLCWFSESRCGAGLTKLKKYSRKRDEKNGTFTNSVAQNGAQHSADSIGYGMTYISEELLGKKVESRGVMKMGYKF